MRRIEISLGGRCNTACVFCPTTYMGDKPAMQLAEIGLKLRTYRIRGYDEVVFSGGEPTISKDLVQAIKLARQAGYKRVGIFTNLLMLSYDRFLDRLMDAGLNKLDFSLYTYGTEAYSEMTRIPQSFDFVLKAIENLKGKRLALTAYLLMTSKSKKELPAMAGLALSLPLEEINFSYISTTELPPEQKHLSVRFRQILPPLSAAIAKAKGVPSVNILRIPPCALGVLREFYHNERMDDIIVVDKDCDFHVRDESLAVMVKPDRCKTCSKNDICPGIIKDYLDRHGGEELDPII
jgi:MoaA/NifB/PqqE/SkfB family radical SAM enzyme